MYDITPILQSIIIIAIGLISIFLVPFIKSKLTAEQQASLAHWVGVAVKAAEMLFPKKKQGELKSEYVKYFLKKYGYEVDAFKLEALIEAAVCELSSDKTQEVAERFEFQNNGKGDSNE